jgi:hypothetical protein
VDAAGEFLNAISYPSSARPLLIERIIVTQRDEASGSGIFYRLGGPNWRAGAVTSGSNTTILDNELNHVQMVALNLPGSQEVRLLCTRVAPNDSSAASEEGSSNASDGSSGQPEQPSAGNVLKASAALVPAVGLAAASVMYAML